MTLVTVVSGPEQPRRWATSEKLRIVEESLAAEQHEAERSGRGLNAALVAMREARAHAVVVMTGHEVELLN
jgi:hypothetical protein